MIMLKEKLKKSIRFRFLAVMSVILFLGTIVSSIVITTNEKAMLEKSLMSKGRSLASFIAKLSKEPLIIKDNLQLDAIVNDANKDEDIVYTVIRDKNGNLLTSQYASINYRSPRLLAILSGLSRETEFQEIIGAIKKQAPVIEFSTPVMVDIEPIGTVTIGMAEYMVRQQVEKTVLVVIALNISLAFALGAALFVASKRIILDPIAKLAAAASLLAKGDLTTLVEVKTTGEVRMLVNSFNQMAADLNKTTVSKDYVDSIIKSMIDTLIVVSPDRKIVLANAAACKLLEYEEKELVGSPIEMIFENGPAGSGAILDEISSRGFISNIETACRTKSGAAVPVLFSGSEISIESKNQGIVYVAKDITEIKKHEEFMNNQEELLKSQKLESLGLLAGGIAHDFNNLLTAILGNISLIKMQSSHQSATCNLLDKAEMASLRAKDLTQQLLTFSRGGAPVKKSASIEQMVMDSVSFSLRGSNVTSRFSIPEDIWPVEVDTGQMSQVINNLAINADQAMPDGGIITVRAQNAAIGADALLPLSEGRYVKISVEDQGIGIPESNIGKIFDPYYTTKIKGSGLGLASAYSIIRNHGGHITVESQPGIGTIFHLYIPASDIFPQKFDGMGSRPPQGKGKILVMDDEEIIREIAGAILCHLGYRVECCVNGTEAVRMYEQAFHSGEPYAAVLMDLTIPGGMGGKETIVSLTEIDPQVKGIVSSGYSNDPVMAKYASYGFRGVVLKPYNAEELGRTLHLVIDPPS
jgi:PAS domain S-box-containing protein